MSDDRPYSRVLDVETLARIERKIDPSVFIPIQCLPPLGIHEHCEHDPRHTEPSFTTIGSAW
jgi:hypothetical protein